MNKFIEKLKREVVPKMNKIAKNPWVAAIQDSIMSIMPVIFIGSIITIISILADYIPNFPDLYLISSFSFGLTSLFLSFLIPFTLMEKLGNNRIKKQAGMAGMAFFLMIVYPGFDEGGNILITFETLGAGGMLGVIISSLFVGVVLNLFGKFTFFKKNTTLPDFVTLWFDTMIPIFIIILTGWVLVFQLDFNVFASLYSMMSPLLFLGQSIWGIVIFNFIGSFLFSFGVSVWIMYPIWQTIMLQGMAENIAAVSAGGVASNIHTSEVVTAFIGIGGHGTTLILVIMMLLLAKSDRLKVVGKATIVPSLFNINEPLIFGAPIAFNPILMIPFWITGIVVPIVVYFLFSIGFSPIPESTFLLWYVPVGIQAWMINQSWTGLIIVAIVLLVSGLIYYPFFRVYDNQLLKEELENVEE